MRSSISEKKSKKSIQNSVCFFQIKILCHLFVVFEKKTHPCWSYTYLIHFKPQQQSGAKLQMCIFYMFALKMSLKSGGYLSLRPHTPLCHELLICLPGTKPKAPDLHSLFQGIAIVYVIRRSLTRLNKTLPNICFALIMHFKDLRRRWATLAANLEMALLQNLINFSDFPL